MNEFEKKKKETKQGVSEELNISRITISNLLLTNGSISTAMKRYNENIIENYYWTMYVTHALHIN